MATLSAPRPVCKPAPQPARGVARLVTPVGETLATPGEIAINDRLYLVGRFPGGFRLGTYDAKTDTANQYDVDAEFTTCTCADHTYRGRRCKHLGALYMLSMMGKLS